MYNNQQVSINQQMYNNQQVSIKISIQIVNKNNRFVHKIKYFANKLRLLKAQYLRDISQ